MNAGSKTSTIIAHLNKQLSLDRIFAAFENTGNNEMLCVSWCLCVQKSIKMLLIGHFTYIILFQRIILLATHPDIHAVKPLLCNFCDRTPLY